jgi:hypothetical protein
MIAKKADNLCHLADEIGKQVPDPIILVTPGCLR